MLGQFLLLAGARIQRVDLGAGMGQEIGIAARAFERLARLLERARGGLHRGMGGAHLARLRAQSAEGIDDGPVNRRVDQRTLVVLAVDLHQFRADVAQQLDRYRLVVEEGAGAPVGALNPPQDEPAVGLEPGLARLFERGMAGGKIEHRGHLALGRARTHQPRVAARAQRQRERIEQDRFARARLPGQDGESLPEIQVDGIDQNDVSNRKACKHDALKIGANRALNPSSTHAVDVLRAQA